ncbi:MAG: diguanylate cyclase [Spirochaetes bacterium]|nr:diguanylate cyclase [Spirochaetota bacterium]
MKGLDFNALDNYSYDIIPGFVDKDLVDNQTKKIVDDLIDRYRHQIFSLILYKLTHLKFQPAEAKKIWQGIISHMHRLNKFLRRNVGIHVATMDYLANIVSKHIKTPVIIDGNYLLDMAKKILIDDVTGLYNINFYEKKIKEEIAESVRNQNPLSLVVINLDSFQKIIENWGLDQANQILKETARVIEKSIRVSDVAIRYESGEFILLLPNTTKKDAFLVAEKIREKVSVYTREKITVSGGVATFLIDTKKDALELYMIAKSALYRAKYEGKNKVCNYPHERREFKRIPVTGQSKVYMHFIRPAGLNKKLNTIKDISKGGISFLLNDVPLNKLDSVEGFVKKDHHQIKFYGQVAWSEKVDENIYGIGVKFLY